MKTAQSVLLCETEVKSTSGNGDCQVRTLRQADGQYLTVAYVPPGIDLDPIVDRYDYGSGEHHQAMVDRCRRWVR